MCAARVTERQTGSHCEEVRTCFEDNFPGNARRGRTREGVKDIPWEEEKKSKWVEEKQYER